MPMGSLHNYNDGAVTTIDQQGEDLRFRKSELKMLSSEQKA